LRLPPKGGEMTTGKPRKMPTQTQQEH
jgi:hypothetical protein